jgi:hypothetical protein
MNKVQFCAFDVLALDWRRSAQAAAVHGKTRLARLLARRPEGIFVNPFERGEIGPERSRQPATWAWRAWCRSDGIARMRQVDRNIG